MQSTIGNHIWDLLATDPERFKQEVKDYFQRGYPDYEIVKYNAAKRIIYLKDMRLR